METTRRMLPEFWDRTEDLLGKRLGASMATARATISAAGGGLFLKGWDRQTPKKIEVCGRDLLNDIHLSSTVQVPQGRVPAKPAPLMVDPC
jgi:hypothetical protein